jgi:hypothetical protein
MATNELPGGGGQGVPRPTFPQRNAFVLQFAADSGPQTGCFQGRIQHVASGRQTAFASLAELWSFIGLVLVTPGDAAAPATGDG